MKQNGVNVEEREKEGKRGRDRHRDRQRDEEMTQITDNILV